MAAHQAPPYWNSPGKNTGVRCHFLLQCMKVKIESEVAQSCPTLSNPMDCSLPGSSIHGIFQARVVEWGNFRMLYKIAQRRKWQPTLVFLPGESNGQGRLAGYTVHGVTKSRTRLSNYTHEMASTQRCVQVTTG